MDEKSYYLLYSGDIKKSFEENNNKKTCIFDRGVLHLHTHVDRGRTKKCLYATGHENSVKLCWKHAGGSART